ncbi:MAG: type IV pilus modification protein PilV [Sutterellaceae bacterium]|nr:type IV pilus modification protein PilV [Burkholderiaceae bacterium]MCX7900712.1 type IV pilus modification protein PilV [Burkholderiaceae bacterium]MDW8429729.1 type IV pilus modification protein PilV [Sutterellaceae bacterium]
MRAAVRAKGATLIEVLVTLVIVAIGLLGLAGLQVRGLAIQKDAHGRALATQLALDMADRMRANVPGVAAGAYRFTVAYPTGPYALPAAPDCETQVCTPQQQAQYDLAGWFARLRGGALPGGWATIDTPLPGEPVWEITMMWVETGLRARAADAAAAGGTNLLNALNVGRQCPANVPSNVDCVRIRVRP